MSSEFGTHPHLLHRSDSPDTSVEAAQVVDTTFLERYVYDAIKGYGLRGCIASDLLKAYPHLPYSSITARFKALSDKGYIRYEGTRQGRSGRSQRVMIATIWDKHE